MANPFIELVQISKIYPTAGGSITALQELDLSVAAGEFVAMIGPSGCGKSTLLRLIGDLDQPSGGTIRIGAKTARQARLDRDYGMVFQAPVLFAWRTVRRNIELPLELIGRPAAQRHARASELLDLVGLSDFADAYPHQLSGGMQQRTALARALSSRPAILLMDEPFGALDELTRERLQLELLRIWSAAERSSTIIFVTHSISEAVFLADRVVVLSPRPGRVTGIVPIDLPRPRDPAIRSRPRFFELITDVREQLRNL